MVSYLLNMNHPSGYPKAKFLKEVLGYEQSDSRLLHKNVFFAIRGKTPNETEITPYGTKHLYRVELVGKKGNTNKAKVVVVIQKDKKRKTYKIVTVYPDKGDK